MLFRLGKLENKYGSLAWSSDAH